MKQETKVPKNFFLVNSQQQHDEFVVGWGVVGCVELDFGNYIHVCNPHGVPLHGFLNVHWH
jgi:hypothetical protein